MASRVPRTIEKFNDYIKNTDDYLQTSRDGTLIYELLGLETADADEWHDKREYWEDTLYPKWSNKLTKTEPVNEKVVNVMREFFDFSKPLLDIMAASRNANEDDANMFNFVLKRKNPSKPTEPITTQCFTQLIILGGAEIQAKNRRKDDRNLPSVAEDAEGVQYAYSLGEENEAPAGPAEADTMLYLTGSVHVLSFGMQNRRKVLYLFTRWFNPKYPQFAGPWTQVMPVVIA